MNTYIDQVYKAAVVGKSKIIFCFKLIYFFMLVVLFFAARSSYLSDDLASYAYEFGLNTGEAAVLLFIITLIPGMMKRFGFKHKLLSLLMIFRRYVGILMYICVLAHGVIVRIVPSLQSGSFVTLQLFEIFGFLSNFLLILLFVTSNDWSTKKLGIWWYRLHRLIYGIMWLVFFHVALQKMSVWTVFMGITVTAMMLSFVLDWHRKKASQV